MKKPLRVRVDSEAEGGDARVEAAHDVPPVRRLRHRPPTRLRPHLRRHLDPRRPHDDFPPNSEEGGVARHARANVEGGQVGHVVHLALVAVEDVHRFFSVRGNSREMLGFAEAGFPFEAEVVLSQVEVGNRRFFQAVSFRHDRQDWYVCKNKITINYEFKKIHFLP